MERAKTIFGKILALTGALIIIAVTVCIAGIHCLLASNSEKIVTYYLCCILSAVIFIGLSRCFKFKTRGIFAGIIILGFLYQFIYSLFAHMTYEGDLRFYFNNAVKLVNGGLSKPLLYHALFPTTITYPAFLSAFMKLFGVHRLIPVVCNQIAMVCFACMVFSFCKRIMPEVWSLAAAFLVCLHPYTIIYSNTCNAELIFSAVIFAAFYAIIRSDDAKSKKFKLTACSLSAVLCGLSNLFRPLGLIMMTAVVLHVLLFKKESSALRFMLVMAMLASYTIAAAGNSLLQERLTGYPPAENKFGWNLYIGASSTGRWNQEDAKVFSEKITTLKTPSEIQAYFAKEGFERYRDMGLRAVGHMRQKLSPWLSNEYMANEAVMQDKNSRLNTADEKNTYLALISFIDLPIFFIGLIGCVLTLLSGTGTKAQVLIPLALYLTGSFLLLMVMEIAPRYTVGYRPVLCVFFIYAIRNILTSASGVRAFIRRIEAKA